MITMCLLNTLLSSWNVRECFPLLLFKFYLYSPIWYKWKSKRWLDFLLILMTDEIQYQLVFTIFIWLLCNFREKNETAQSWLLTFVVYLFQMCTSEGLLNFMYVFIRLERNACEAFSPFNILHHNNNDRVKASWTMTVKHVEPCQIMVFI